MYFYICYYIYLLHLFITFIYYIYLLHLFIYLQQKKYVN
jgi:hypothetical protein